MKQFSVLIPFIIISTFAFATHNIAGQISHKCLGGSDYEITVTTYTQGKSSQADRCTQTIHFGDGDSAIVCRSNFEPGDPTSDFWGAGGCVNNPFCSTHHMGEWNIGSPTLLSMGIKKNVYTTTHTFIGAGPFIITVKDPNFEDNIINLSNQQPFTLIDTLVIDLFITCNSSPVFSHIPIDTAFLFQPYLYNPGAVDPDGDSLSYRLIPPYGTTSYVDPIATDSFTINPKTGDVSWINPYTIGKFVFCILVDEWKKLPTNGQYFWAGSSMQIVSIIGITSLGISENSDNNILLNTFPNPSSSKINFTLQESENWSGSTISIFDYSGRKLNTIDLLKNEYSLDVSKYLGGIYFYHLVSPVNGFKSGKFEVSR